MDSSLTVTPDKSRIILELTIDSEISAVMDYFQIFLGRMQMSKSAANALNLSFSLVINGQKLL